MFNVAYNWIAIGYWFTVKRDMLSFYRHSMHVHLSFHSQFLSLIFFSSLFHLLFIAFIIKCLNMANLSVFTRDFFITFFIFPSWLSTLRLVCVFRLFISIYACQLVMQSHYSLRIFFSFPSLIFMLNLRWKFKSQASKLMKNVHLMKKYF